MTIQLQSLKITNRLLVQEAIRRGWQVEVLDYRIGLVQYTHHQRGYAMTMRSTSGPYTRATDLLIADDKLYCGTVARKLGVAVPETEVYESEPAAQDLLDRIGQVVVKPLDGAHGNGISLGVGTADALRTAVIVAKEYSNTVLLQQQVIGGDLRVVCIGGKAVVATRRSPAAVTGDGVHTISQLIDAENSSGKRGPDYSMPRNLIHIPAATRYLGERMASVPPAGQEVQVVGMVNMGMGGSAQNVPLDRFPHAVKAAQAIAQHLDLAICGVDFLISDADDALFFIELNGSPSFGLHVYPALGEPVQVHQLYWDWLEQRLQAGDK